MSEPSLLERTRAFAHGAAPRVEATLCDPALSREAAEHKAAALALELLAEEGLLAWTIPARDGGSKEMKNGGSADVVRD